eukprot:jgi/Tetstr1/429678/TSEL_019575.t1
MERFDMELSIARHIPGRENTLAECLSRLRGAIDDQDRRLLIAVLHELEAACGPLRRRRLLRPLRPQFIQPCFRSTIDNCLAHGWAGREVAPNEDHRSFSRETGRGYDGVATFAESGDFASARRVAREVMDGLSYVVASLSAHATSKLPRMPCDVPRDFLRMRKLPDGFVCAPGHGSPRTRLPEWRRLLAGADGLEDLRLRSSTNDIYRSNMRDLRSFCTTRGSFSLCSVRPARRHKRLCIIFLELECLRRAAVAAHTTYDHHVSGSGAVSYAELSVVARVLFGAEIGCCYNRMRMDVDKSVVDARLECFAYIPDHVPCLAIRPVDMLEDYPRVFSPPMGGHSPVGRPQVLRRQTQNFHTTLYSCFNSAFKAAYARAFPNPDTRMTPLDRVSSHSGRKSLAQWLWDRPSRHGSSRMSGNVRAAKTRWTPTSRHLPPRFFGSSPPSIYFT